jgi:hypothetical protein
MDEVERRRKIEKARYWISSTILTPINMERKESQAHTGLSR